MFTMSNSQYIINLGNLNSISGQVSGGGTKLTFTSGETGAGLYTGTNYKLCAGFYGGIFCNITPSATSPATATFSFTIDPTTIAFGAVDPTFPVTRNNTLTVSSNQAFGYTVTAIENHPLRTPSGSVIPNTTCDTGLCSATTAQSWSNTLTYGFGYRCDNVVGTDCVTDFSNSTFYKPFANLLLAQAAQSVMAGTTSPLGRKTEITYKVNVATTQPPGTYSNTISYVATPNF